MADYVMRVMTSDGWSRVVSAKYQYPMLCVIAENGLGYLYHKPDLTEEEMEYINGLLKKENEQPEEKPEEKPEETQSTIMQKWAEESLRYSESLNRLFSEFGFRSTYFVKQEIKHFFNNKYLKLYGKLDTDMYNISSASVVNLAKALLVSSAYLETTDLRKIIDWADEN